MTNLKILSQLLNNPKIRVAQTIRIPTDPTPGENGRYLVVFASRSGNTERVAQTIRATLGCDMLEVEPSEPYEEDYNSTLERAQTELDGIAEGISPPYGRWSRISRSTISVFGRLSIWYNRIATPMPDVPAPSRRQTCRQADGPLRHERRQRHQSVGK